jgi:hypothetical protein
MPAPTSTTKWFAVATTENAIASGPTTAARRTTRDLVAVNTTIPSSTFQPTWRLGKAAYWLVSPGGWSARYELDWLVTVSTSPTSSSRGGATGTSAKNRNPIAPDTKNALRSR